MVEIMLRKALIDIPPVKFYFVVYRDVATGQFYHNGHTVIARDRIKNGDSEFFASVGAAVLDAYKKYEEILKYANSEI